MHALTPTTVVNPVVVRALMTLRGHSRQTLSVAAGVREDNLRAWLASADGSELCLARKNQVLVLRTLGIAGDKPRTDTVHLWLLDESSGVARNEGLDALSVAIAAFGPAEVIHFGRERDQLFSFSEDVYFGLRFANFRVVLRVRPGFLRAVKFGPAALKDLAWSSVNPVCMLPDHRFDQICRADVTPGEFEDFASGLVEMEKWENLLLLAREHHVTAQQIAKWVVTEVQRREASVALTFSELNDDMLMAPKPIEPAANPVAAAPDAPAAQASAPAAPPVAEVPPVAAQAPAAPAPTPAPATPKAEVRADPTPGPRTPSAPAEEPSNVVTGLFMQQRVKA